MIDVNEEVENVDRDLAQIGIDFVLLRALLENTNERSRDFPRLLMRLRNKAEAVKNSFNRLYGQIVSGFPVGNRTVVMGSGDHRMIYATNIPPVLLDIPPGTSEELKTKLIADAVAKYEEARKLEADRNGELE